MIGELLFKIKMKELSTLMNTKITDTFVTEAYRRISGGTYTEQDLSRAVEEVLNGDSNRITFPALIKALNNARGVRFDKESQDRQAKEQREHQMFWDRAREFVHEPCLEHKCYACPPDKLNYCEDVAMRTLQLIKEKFAMEDCPWSINDRLMKEFSGYGFEVKYGRHTWAKKVEGKWVGCDEKGNTKTEEGRR